MAKKRKTGEKHKGWKSAAKNRFLGREPDFVCVVGLGPKLSKKVRVTYKGKPVPHS